MNSKVELTQDNKFGNSFCCAKFIFYFYFNLSTVLSLTFTKTQFALGARCFNFDICRRQKLVIVFVPLYIHWCSSREGQLPFSVFTCLYSDWRGEFAKSLTLNLWWVF